MPTTPKIAGLLFTTLFLVISTSSRAQVHPILPDQISDDYQPFPLRQTPISFEVNLILQPVYLFQFGSHYRLNGHTLQIPKAYAPHFYSTRPFQRAFSSIGETADQANSAYASFYLTVLENSAIPVFHHIRFVAGATHEKLDTDSTNVSYRYYDGGTEATFLLEKNISYRLSNRQYQSNGIIFAINAQAGIFGVVAKPRTLIFYNNYFIYSTNTDRYQWPSFRNGWGWIAGANVEVGGVLCHDYFICDKFTKNCFLGKWLFGFCRRVGVTLGSKLMMEALYSADGVFTLGLPGMNGGRLRVDHYAVFLNGPTIGIKWMNRN